MIRIYNKDGVVLNTKDKYCTENIEVSIDSTNLSPENIVEGKVILGVTGIAGGSDIPEGYIKPQGTYTATENGTFDITEYANVKVNVPLDPTGTFENYDGSILLNGEAYIIDNSKPIATDIVLTTSPEIDDEEKTTIQLTPTLASTYTNKAYYGNFYHHTRFYFDVPTEAVGSSCKILVDCKSGFKGIGNLDTAVEAGSSTSENYISTHSSVGSSAPLTYTFTNLEAGRHFVDVQVVAYTSSNAIARAIWEIVE